MSTPASTPVGIQVSTVRTPTAAATRELGRSLAALLGAGDVVVLAGALGAGKTTLTQGLADGLGVRGPITSPTFVLSRVHPSLVGGPALVHVDAYRLRSAAEVDDLDLEESLAGAVTVVEWGTGLVEGLSPDRLEVVLERASGDGAAGHEPAGAALAGDELAGDELRVVRLRGVGPRWDAVELPGAAGPAARGGDPAAQEGDGIP